jgi:hypothetical protein
MSFKKFLSGYVRFSVTACTLGLIDLEKKK